MTIGLLPDDLPGALPDNAPGVIPDDVEPGFTASGRRGYGVSWRSAGSGTHGS
jgi:hypothetical protein